jgi:hypothetical protein
MEEAERLAHFRLPGGGACERLHLERKLTFKGHGVCMRRIVCFASLAVVVASAGAQLTAPVAPVRPVTDVYFGTSVVDPYRWMETGGDELLAYMKAENAVTQQALQPFAAQDAQLLTELTKLADVVTAVGAPVRNLDEYFYLELPPGKSAAAAGPFNTGGRDEACGNRLLRAFAGWEICRGRSVAGRVGEFGSACDRRGVWQAAE